VLLDRGATSQRETAERIGRAAKAQCAARGGNGAEAGAVLVQVDRVRVDREGRAGAGVGNGAAVVDSPGAVEGQCAAAGGGLLDGRGAVEAQVGAGVGLLDVDGTARRFDLSASQG